MAIDTETATMELVFAFNEVTPAPDSKVIFSLLPIGFGPETESKVNATLTLDLECYKAMGEPDTIHAYKANS